jgi:hypothetical protein
VILAGAIVPLITAVVAQRQPVLIVRTLVGVVIGIRILRRIVFPPDIADPVRSQFAVFVGLAGAICAVFGGIVDTTREVAERYPEVAFWRPPAGELGSDPPQPQGAARMRQPNDPRSGGAVVDSTAEEIRSRVAVPLFDTATPLAPLLGELDAAIARRRRERPLHPRRGGRRLRARGGGLLRGGPRDRRPRRRRRADDRPPRHGRRAGRRGRRPVVHVLRIGDGRHAGLVRH